MRPTYIFHMLFANDTKYFNKWKNVNDIVNTMNINKLFNY